MTAENLALNNFEKRRDHRFLVEDNFQIKILFSSDNPKALGKTFSCAAINVSKNGIQISSRDPLAVKSVLDIRIDIKDSEHSYTLTGNVKWCKPKIGLSHTIGIQLKQRHGTPTDLTEWKKLIKLMK